GSAEPPRRSYARRISRNEPPLASLRPASRVGRPRRRRGGPAEARIRFRLECSAVHRTALGREPFSLTPPILRRLSTTRRRRLVRMNVSAERRAGVLAQGRGGVLDQG